MIKKVMENGKLIFLDKYYFNPFEVNDVSSDLSMIPVFSYKVEDLIGEPSLHIKNEILFSPNSNLYEIVNQLMFSGVPESDISKLLVGSIVKVNYQSWCSYFRITRFIENETLEDFKIDLSG